MSGLDESAQAPRSEPDLKDIADGGNGAGVHERGGSEGAQPDGGQRRRQVQEDEENEDREANRNRVRTPEGEPEE